MNVVEMQMYHAFQLSVLILLTWASYLYYDVLATAYGVWGILMIAILDVLVISYVVKIVMQRSKGKGAR